MYYDVSILGKLEAMDQTKHETIALWTLGKLEEFLQTPATWLCPVRISVVLKVHVQEAVAEKSFHKFCHAKEKWVGILTLFKSQRFLISLKSRYFAVF